MMKQLLPIPVLFLLLTAFLTGTGCPLQLDVGSASYEVGTHGVEVFPVANPAPPQGQHPRLEVTIRQQGNQLIATPSSDKRLNPQTLRYQWYRNDERIPRATGSSYMPQGEGSYHVEITSVETDCHARSSYLYINQPATGSGNLGHTATAGPVVDIFPNPGSGFVTVSFATVEQKSYMIKLYNMFGKEEQTWSYGEKSFTVDHTLNIDHLPDGIYFVEVKMDDHSYVRKIVKY